MLSFQTTLNGLDVSIYNFSDYSHEIENAEFTISWTLELETREWGVKDVAITLVHIKGSFDVVYYDLDGDETTNETITFDFSEFKKLTFIELEWTDYRSLSPDDIAIDYKEKTVRIS